LLFFALARVMPAVPGRVRQRLAAAKFAQRQAELAEAAAAGPSTPRRAQRRRE
jgi:hypothetical protein